MDLNKLSSRIINVAIEVHKELGPGLLESVYEECMCYELQTRDLGFERQKLQGLSNVEQPRLSRDCSITIHSAFLAALR